MVNPASNHGLRRRPRRLQRCQQSTATLEFSVRSQDRTVLVSSVRLDSVVSTRLLLSQSASTLWCQISRHFAACPSTDAACTAWSDGLCSRGVVGSWGRRITRARKRDAASTDLDLAIVLRGVPHPHACCAVCKHEFDPENPRPKPLMSQLTRCPNRMPR